MNAAKAAAISLAALFLARGPALTGCGTTTDTPTIPPTSSRPAPDGQWIVKATYHDPQSGHTTVICVDHHGDLKAASGWRQIDAVAPVGAPCPPGAVLMDATTIAGS